MTKRLPALALVIATSACDSQAPRSADTMWVTSQDSAFTYLHVAADRAFVTALKAQVRTSSANAAAFFGKPFVSGFEAAIYPNRQEFLARWQQIWNQPGVDPGCWFVAAGGRAGFQMLSPRLWRTETCGHTDAAAHVAGIVAHELVHVLHDQQQRAQLPNATQFQTARWMFEGLAVYASGQLDREYGPQARQRFSAGFAPTTIAEVTNDPALYGLAGSLIAHIDAIYGREKVSGLFTARSSAEAFASLGTTEAALLSAWRTRVLAQP